MDNKITVDNFKPLKLKKLYSGRNGTCYLTEDNEVFKHIETPNEESLKSLTKLNSNSFVFPKKLVYNKNGKLVGYIMDYVNGTTIKNMSGSTRMDYYRNGISQIENDIAILTNYKLHIIDAGVNNIMIDSESNLKIVDTDFYETKSALKNLYQANLTSVNYGLMYPIHDISIQDFENDQLNKYLRWTLDGKMKVSELLYELGGEIYLRGMYPENTISEYKNQLKLIRKKL